MDLQIENGVFGLLGPNGAGKTTLLRALSTVATPSGGELALLGESVKALSSSSIRHLRRRIGYAPQQAVALRHLTALEQVMYAAWLKQVPRGDRREKAIAALDQVGLSERSMSRVGTLSGGMLRRLNIAMALAHEPALVLLDEPTAGLDPEQRIQFREMIRKLSSTSTVVLSTHLVEDVASICDSVGVLSEGRVVFHGNVASLAAMGADGATTDRSPIEAGFVAVIGGRRA